MVTPERQRRVTGVVVEHFGDWQNAKLGTLPVPPPGPGEVLIECQAAALNFQDLLMIEGRYQHKPATPFFAGGDVAGKIIAIGPDVEKFAIGQRVAAVVPFGAFAELSLAQTSRCFPVPDNLDSAKATACTTVFSTVVVALSIRGRIQAGERLLVTGAAGGVGIATIQYARKIGAEVIALVSSDAKEQVARRAGAHHILRLDRLTRPKEDLRDALASSAIDGVDIVLDVIGGDVFDGAIRCLRPGGRLVVVGFASGRIPDVKANYLLLKGISVIGSSLEMGFRHNGPALMEMMSGVYNDIAKGEFDPFITETYPLREFHNAAAQISNRSALGKIVLIP